MPDHDQQPEPSLDALIVAARADREAFGQLYERYYERILRYCRGRLGQRAAAEDACGEVFLFVARKMPSFRGETETDFRRWVYSIATNVVNAQLRKNTRRKELWEKGLEQNRFGVADAIDPCDPDDAALVLQVRRAISRLNPTDQSIVTLRLLEGLPHTEIAQILRKRPGAVRTAYSRSIERLREQLLRVVSNPNDALCDEAGP